jgi:PAS domain S-box-containing protein
MGNEEKDTDRNGTILDGSPVEDVLRYSPGGIFSYSAEEDEQFLYISDNMLTFLGYTRDEFTEKFSNRFSLMVYREDRERALDEIAEQIKHGPYDTCSYRIERKDGTLVWVHDEGHIVTGADGRRRFYVVIVDVTDNVRRHQAEREKFRASMQALLAANPDAVGTVMLNLTGNTCSEGHGISAVTRQMTAAKTADAFFSGVASWIDDPAVRRRFLDRFDRNRLVCGFRSGRTHLEMEYQRKNDEGRPLWIRLYLNMLVNPDNGDIEGVAYSADISREKKRDEIMRIITNQEYDLIALIHLDIRTVEAYFIGDTLPEAYRELLPEQGATCSLDVFRNNAIEKWLFSDEKEKYRKYSDPDYYRPIMESGVHYEFVLRERFHEADGGEMYRKFQHYYLGNDHDTILVIESDVTQACLRQNEELNRAKAETDRIRDIMDSITSGICVLHMPDSDHLMITYVNQQMFRMLGFKPAGIGPADDADSAEPLVSEYMNNAFVGVHPDDIERVRKTFHDNFYSDHFLIDNYRTRGAGGKYCWVKEEVILREITGDYRVFYATFHNATEEVRLNAELNAQLEREKQLRKEATSANAAKTDFLSRMSHDIRTPLNGIIGMTYIAKEQDNPEKTADCLDKIDTSSKFLLGLINDILDMSRAESSRMQLNPEPYPINEFNEYLNAVFTPLCREKGQQFILDEKMALHDVVPVADKLRCNQIIFNLLSNAVKYTPEGGTVTYRIRGEYLTSGKIRIFHEISDNGIGMSEDFQKILFEPFTQENRNDSSEKRGTGLGLAIVKKLVEVMNGTITVSSSPGKGTTFFLTLTFDSVPVGEQGKTDSGSAAVDNADICRLDRKHVLVCEDHPLNQEIARTLLEQQGASVETADNGKIGMELFMASPIGYYDVILMDVRMPVMDGYEATRSIRESDRADAKTVPIVAMTADAFEDDVRHCMEAGMDGHISKPVEPEIMYAKLAEVMSRHIGGQ